MKELLELEFVLALKLHLSPLHLNEMDCAEVKNLHDELVKYLSEKGR